jgi:hypothetical protein
VTADDTATRVRQLLTALYDPTNTTVDPADQVANRLRALDIKGHTDSPHSCPVARYLLTADGVVISGIAVSPDEIALLLIDGDTETYEYVDPTDAVAKFVVRFDHGVYLDLILVEAVPA